MVLGLVALIPSAFAEQPSPDTEAGRVAYEQHCSRCHGITGKGDGFYGKRLYPKPRDLTSGIFKFRSTESGSAPTDDDLFYTLSHGLNAGGMPDWVHLDEATRWQLVYYLKTLTPVFEDQPAVPITIGQDPGAKAANLARGKQLYEQLGCAACHGASGRANGTSAATLVDGWNAAVRPANLTQGWNFRGGSEPRALVTRVLAGIDGSPMPSYAEAVSREDAWHLAYYLQSLQETPHWRAMVQAIHVIGELPQELDDHRWQQAERFEVRLRNAVDANGEMTGPQTVTLLSVWALANDEALALRLRWDDPSQEASDPSDALAVALQPEGVAGDLMTLQTWPLRDSPPLDLCLWSAQGPLASEAVVTTYEPLLQAAGKMPVRSSQAKYEDGQWGLTMIRPLKPIDIQGAATLERDRMFPMAFAIWDGGNPTQRTVSPWIDVHITKVQQGAVAQQSVPVAVWVAAGAVLLVGIVLVMSKVGHSHGRSH